MAMFAARTREYFESNAQAPTHCGWGKILLSAFKRSARISLRREGASGVGGAGGIGNCRGLETAAKYLGKGQGHQIPAIMAEHEAFHKKKELGNSRTRRPRGEVWGSAIRSADIGRPDQSNGRYKAWISFNVKDAKYAAGRIYTVICK